MNEVVVFGREEYDPSDKVEKVPDEQLRALEFYIGGMNNHEPNMPHASLNMASGQIEIFDDCGDIDPPIRLAHVPSSQLVRGFLQGNGKVTFNPEGRILELHTRF